MMLEERKEKKKKESREKRTQRKKAASQVLSTSVQREKKSYGLIGDERTKVAGRPLVR